MLKSKLGTDDSPEAATLDPATTSRRVRNFSREICFALVLTAVAIASFIGFEDYRGTTTASVEAHQAANAAGPTATDAH